MENDSTEPAANGSVTENLPGLKFGIRDLLAINLLVAVSLFLIGLTSVVGFGLGVGCILFLFWHTRAKTDAAWPGASIAILLSLVTLGVHVNLEGAMARVATVGALGAVVNTLLFGYYRAGCLVLATLVSFWVYSAAVQ